MLIWQVLVSVRYVFFSSIGTGSSGFNKNFSIWFSHHPVSMLTGFGSACLYVNLQLLQITQISFTAKHAMKPFWRDWIIFTLLLKNYPAGIHLLKVNNRNTRTSCEICSKLTIETTERRHWRVFFVNFEYISHVFLVFLLLTLSRSMPTEHYLVLGVRKAEIHIFFDLG